MSYQYNINQISLSSLTGYKNATLSANNNVANATSKNYIRENTTSSSVLYGGVNVSSASVNYNSFLDFSLQQTSSKLSQYETTIMQAEQFQSTLTPSSLANLDAAWSDVANDPSNLAVKNAVIQANQSFVSNSNLLTASSESLTAQNSDNTLIIKDSINSIANQLVSLNKALSFNKNDSKLLEERNNLLDNLSQYTDFKTSENSTGGIDVHINNGSIPLISDNTVNQLNAENSQSGTVSLYLSNAGQKIPFNPTQGTIGAFKQINNLTTQTLNQIGLSRVSYTLLANIQNRVGFDTQGQHGIDLFSLNGQNSNGNFFTALTQKGESNTNNTGNATVTINLESQYLVSNTDISNTADANLVANNIGLLKANNYQLSMVNGQFHIEDQNEKPIPTTQDANGIHFDGLIVKPTGTMNNGDKFSLNFLTDSLSKLSVVETNGTKLSTRANNTGSPEPIGSNQNALLLSKLSKTNHNFSPLHSIENNALGYFGEKLNTIKTQKDSEQVIFTQLTNTRESKYGVNLDEEAAKLQSFQQVYQASAISMTKANALFDSLMKLIV
jgi:flagellar hook-associated protein 1 FlgK